MKRILVVVGDGLAGIANQGVSADAAVRCGESLGVAVEVAVASEGDRLRPDIGVFDAVVVDAAAWKAISASARIPVVRVASGCPADERDLLHRGTGVRSTETIWGRGVDGICWAIRHLVWTAASTPEHISYGAHPDQMGDLRIPAGPGPHPVALLLHGGGWRSHWARDLMDGIAVDLTGRGFATWNAEYRRVGVTGGGWPQTFEDVGAATDALDELARTRPLDLDRVVAIGHSAGGHLALWAAARPKFAEGAVGCRPRVRVSAVVSIAGVCDLVEAAEAGISRGAVVELLGGTPIAVSDRYAATSPVAFLPIGVPQLLAHGEADDRVPVDMSASYHKAARGKGDLAEFVVLERADHFAVIDPGTHAWGVIVTHLATMLEACGWPRLRTSEGP